MVPVATGMRGAYYGARFASGLRRRQGIRYAARAGVSTAKFAYAHRRGIKRTVEKFARQRGRAKKRRRKSNAYPSVTKSRIKTTIDPATPGQVTAFAPKSLNIQEVRYVQAGIGDDKRNSSQIYIKGVNVCLNFFNRAPYPIELHWALIQFADEDGIDLDRIKKEFFRDSGTSGSGKNMDFVDDAIFDRKYLCNPLNPDNKRILSHKRWRVWANIGGNATNNAQAYHDNHLKYVQYHKIGRTVHLDGNFDIENEKPLYKVMWWLPIDPNDMNKSASCDYDEIEKVYWKNVTS